MLKVRPPGFPRKKQKVHWIIFVHLSNQEEASWRAGRHLSFCGNNQCQIIRSRFIRHLYKKGAQFGKSDQEIEIIMHVFSFKFISMLSLMLICYKHIRPFNAASKNTFQVSISLSYNKIKLISKLLNKVPTVLDQRGQEKNLNIVQNAAINCSS